MSAGPAIAPPLLDSIDGPRDLDGLTSTQLDTLAAQIRAFLVDQVCQTGGHLGPNLGVVELTIALHRVFDSPNDAILWDTGHQAYVHKILTGRRRDFDTLRRRNGLSGYPSRAESPHDIIENSHASTALAYADGIAKSWELAGELSTGSGGRHVVAVVGDGSLTGGMAWEALNNIADSDRQVIIVVNDNARSYAPTIGGMAQHLASLRAAAGYERALKWGRRVLRRTPVVGRPAYETLHGLKKGVKDIVSPQGLFEDLGLKYLGPVDGHDIEALMFTLRLARKYQGPVIVHAITEKGHGYAPAEADESDRFHGVGVIDPETGLPISSAKRSWTSVFSRELVSLGERDSQIVAITAAMQNPVGLTPFAERFPDRVFDVGIAEQHAVASAAGMAFAGLHPVVAIYSTFLNRAFDQLLLDAALHRAPVTLVLDRAGVTGEDGPSHHGLWDLAVAGIVPGIAVAAPRDGTRLARQLGQAVANDSGPTIVRFPKGPVPADIDPVDRFGSVDLLYQQGAADILLIAVGAMAGLSLDVADKVAGQGIGITVVDPGWVFPVAADLVVLARSYRLVVSLEDGVRSGGVGPAISRALRENSIDIPFRNFGLPPTFLEPGSRDELLAANGLTATDISRELIELANG